MKSRRSRSPSFRPTPFSRRSEEHTSELQSQSNLVCRLLLEKKKKKKQNDQKSRRRRYMIRKVKHGREWQSTNDVEMAVPETTTLNILIQLTSRHLWTVVVPK